MTDPAPGPIRRATRAAFVAIAVLAAAWALLLLVFGGLDIQFSGRRLTTNEPLRPLLVMSVALTVFALAGGALRAPGRLFEAVRRTEGRWVAAGLAAGVTALGLTFGTTAASGADAYGYVSQADLWLGGRVIQPHPWMAEVPWPSKRWTFAPLGYRPLEGEGEWAIVPTYAPGLPLLMAGAKAVAGHCAMFWVVPLAGGVLVLATWGIGRRLGSPWAGLIGAWLVATSPPMLFILAWPMTDVPVAAAWAASFFFLLGRGRAAAAGAGLAAAVAILIRPNLVGAAGLMGLWYLARAVRSGAASRRGRLADVAIFGAASALGAIATAAINQHLYGSPATSGYGGLGDMFSRANLLPNLSRYLGWFVQTHTPLALAGLAAVFVPWRRLWPGVRDRSVLLLVAAFVAVVWVQYLAYLVFEDWWYQRFLLPTWPFIMIGIGAVAVACVRAGRPVVAGLAVTAAVALGVFGFTTAVRRSAFELWQGERRYVSVAHLVRDLTDRNAVLFSMQHSGSLRYYAGRMTLRYDNLDNDWLDRAVAWLDARGARPYLLVEDWEIPDIRRQFAGQRTLDVLETPPVFVYRGAATILLYDLTRPRDPRAEADSFIETYRDLHCVPPAPAPRFAPRD